MQCVAHLVSGESGRGVDRVPDRCDLRGVVRTRATRPRAATTPAGTPMTSHDTVLTARRIR